MLSENTWWNESLINPDPLPGVKEAPDGPADDRRHGLQAQRALERRSGELICRHPRLRLSIARSIAQANSGASGLRIIEPRALTSNVLAETGAGRALSTSTVSATTVSNVAEKFAELVLYRVSHLPASWWPAGWVQATYGRAEPHASALPPRLGSAGAYVGSINASREAVAAASPRVLASSLRRIVET